MRLLLPLLLSLSTLFTLAITLTLPPSSPTSSLLSESPSHSETAHVTTSANFYDPISCHGSGIWILQSHARSLTNSWCNRHAGTVVRDTGQNIWGLQGWERDIRGRAIWLHIGIQVHKKGEVYRVHRDQCQTMLEMVINKCKGKKNPDTRGGVYTTTWGKMWVDPNE
ncbi:hypothetical protein EX30DRAFT_395948 [Ascodesmis nigricans]|uniref:Ecp2 effector protein domain-containing protein n=1 Tax=Ascodesmis nigricans TaxID=341454 RepID=A0A4S2MW76_9PEZI|nr:hypothetical protein EX30DRAFT_395948 [Ascodesmis nigricans]